MNLKFIIREYYKVSRVQKWLAQFFNPCFFVVKLKVEIHISRQLGKSVEKLKLKMQLSIGWKVQRDCVGIVLNLCKKPLVAINELSASRRCQTPIPGDTHALFIHRKETHPGYTGSSQLPPRIKFPTSKSTEKLVKGQGHSHVIEINLLDAA